MPATGHAILFGRSIAAVLPPDLPVPLSLAVLDVCGAPALTSRVVRGYSDPRVLYISMHEYPLYPGTGWIDETGAGAGQGATIN